MLASRKFTLASGVKLTLEAWHTTYWPTDKRKKPVKFENHMSASLSLDAGKGRPDIRLYLEANFHESDCREENLAELVQVLALLKASPNDIEDIKASVFSLATELNIHFD